MRFQCPEIQEGAITFSGISFALWISIPATLVVGTMRAAALTRSDAPPDEVPDYGIRISGNPQEYLNIVGAEEIHGF
jgi:hypothetical protein